MVPILDEPRGKGRRYDHRTSGAAKGTSHSSGQQRLTSCTPDQLWLKSMISRNQMDFKEIVPISALQNNVSRLIDIWAKT